MKTNSLTYTTIKTVDKYDCIIKISLNDECKNGHEDFSITGSIYKKGKRSYKDHISCGAIGDKIASLFPEFKIFNDLHLSTFQGVPMYAIENGFHHMKQGTDFKSYLRLTDQEVEILKKAEDKDYFKYLICKLNIIERWQSEANKAIKILEELTGNEFESTASEKWVSLTKEEMNEYQLKEISGYYSDEAIKQRELEGLENVLSKLDKTKLPENITIKY